MKKYKVLKVNLHKIVKGIDKRQEEALEALGQANKGEFAERTGLSSKTADRIINR